MCIRDRVCRALEAGSYYVNARLVDADVRPLPSEALAVYEQAYAFAYCDK